MSLDLRKAAELRDEVEQRIAEVKRLLTIDEPNVEPIVLRRARATIDKVSEFFADDLI